MPLAARNCRAPRRRWVYDRCVELLERDAELRPSTHQWRRARSSFGSFVFVAGESGIGKSELVRCVRRLRRVWGLRRLGRLRPAATPRPLGPLHDVAASSARRARELLGEAARRTRSLAAVFDDLRAADGAGRRRPALGRPGHGRPAPLPARRVARPRALAGRRHRPRRRGRRRPPAAGAARRRGPLAGRDVAHAAAAERRRRSRRSLGRSPRRRRPAAAAHRRATRSSSSRCSTTSGDDLPATVRDAVLARTADSTPRRGTSLHLLACAPEAIPDHLLGTSASGCRRCAPSTEPGLIRRGARGVAFRHDLCRLAVAEHDPARRRGRRCTGGCSTALESAGGADAGGARPPRARRRRRARILRYATAAGRRRGAVGRPHAGGRVLRMALDHGARSSRGAGRAARAAGRRVLPDRPARRRDRCVRAGDGRCGASRRRRPG